MPAMCDGLYAKPHTSPACLGDTRMRFEIERIVCETLLGRPVVPDVKSVSVASEFSAASSSPPSEPNEAGGRGISASGAACESAASSSADMSESAISTDTPRESAASKSRENSKRFCRRMSGRSEAARFAASSRSAYETGEGRSGRNGLFIGELFENFPDGVDNAVFENIDSEFGFNAYSEFGEVE